MDEASRARYAIYIFLLLVTFMYEYFIVFQLFILKGKLNIDIDQTKYTDTFNGISIESTNQPSSKTERYKKQRSLKIVYLHIT